MWTEAIRRAGVDPTRLQLPGCDSKVDHSIEIPWNYIKRDDALIDGIALALEKIQRNVGALAA
jgi:hypothetical protein